MKKTAIGLTLAASLLLPYGLLAQMDSGRSSVVAISKQMGVPVEGDFKRFNAQVSFDPTKPAEAKASVEIDIASFDIGAEDYNREVRKPEWFDAARHPKATFVTTAIKPVGTGRYEASGRLTIKGVSRNVVAPVSFKAQGKQQVFEGVLPIRRLHYNIGSGEWKDTSIVADEVQVRFRIVMNNK